jgi:hypothetical protein
MQGNADKESNLIVSRLDYGGAEHAMRDISYRAWHIQNCP